MQPRLLALAYALILAAPLAACVEDPLVDAPMQDQKGIDGGAAQVVPSTAGRPASLDPVACTETCQLTLDQCLASCTVDLAAVDCGCTCEQQFERCSVRCGGPERPRSCKRQ